jgi:hypothetical protein
MDASFVFSPRQIAEQAAISFVENLCAQGKAACVAVSAKEELTDRKLEPPACAPQTASTRILEPT